MAQVQNNVITNKRSDIMQCFDKCPIVEISDAFSHYFNTKSLNDTSVLSLYNHDEYDI